MFPLATQPISHSQTDSLRYWVPFPKPPMNTTKLKELYPEDASESVRLADEYTPFVFSGDEHFETGRIYLFAAPNTPALERQSTELAVTLSREAPVLLINSCIETHAMRVYLKETGGDTMPIKTIPLDDASLALRYEALCDWIEQRKAKALVINCFENAATTARHQTQLAQLLHQLRNKYELAIFVYSSHPLQRLQLCRNTRRGAHGHLTFLAAKILEAGSQFSTNELLAEPKYKALMKEHEETKVETPPPPQPLDLIPLEEFNRNDAEKYIDKEDYEEEWMKEKIGNYELGITNEERRMQARICHSEAIAEESEIA